MHTKPTSHTTEIYPASGFLSRAKFSSSWEIYCDDCTKYEYLGIGFRAQAFAKAEKHRWSIITDDMNRWNSYFCAECTSKRLR